MKYASIDMLANGLNPFYLFVTKLSFEFFLDSVVEQKCEKMKEAVDFLKFVECCWPLQELIS